MHEKKNTILVVDDEPQIQKMLGILLDVGNYKILESLSGKQAIRLFGIGEWANHTQGEHHVIQRFTRI